MQSGKFIEWLTSHSKEFSLYNAYYYQPQNYYYQHDIDVEAVTLQLGGIGQIAAISARDPKRLQNAFHATLSHSLYPNSHSNEVAVVKSTKIKSTISTIAREQTSHIAAKLLKPFEGDHHQLMLALSATDTQGKTPLHYLYETNDHFSNSASLTDFHTRIANIPEEKIKEHLATQEDQQGRHIFFPIITWDHHVLETAINSYGEKATLVALKKPDLKKNTVLHATCENEYYSHEKIQILCRVIEKAVKDEKKPSPTLTNLFSRNQLSQNPFHLAACNPVDIVTPLCKIAGVDLTLKNAIELDIKGFTPFHYAIKSNSIIKIRAFLNPMNIEMKQKIVGVKTNQGESAIHLASSYGSPEILEELIKVMDVVEFNSIMKDKASLLKLVSKNKYMSHTDFNNITAKYDALFNVYRYLLSRVPRLFHLRKDEDFTDRLNHFKDTLDCLANEKPLPDAHQFCRGKVFASHNRYYTALSEAKLNTISPVQLERFNNLIKKSSTTPYNSLFKPIAGKKPELPVASAPNTNDKPAVDLYTAKLTH